MSPSRRSLLLFTVLGASQLFMGFGFVVPLQPHCVHPVVFFAGYTASQHTIYDKRSNGPVCFIATKVAMVVKYHSGDDNEENSRDKNEDEESIDLFEYFDPLRSPHEYPNGIEAKKKATQLDKSTEINSGCSTHGDDSSEESINSSDPFQWRSLRTVGFSSTTTISTKRNSNRPFGLALPDDFPVGISPGENTSTRLDIDPSKTFDPTLSPHLYTNGVPDVIVGDLETQYLVEDDLDDSVPNSKTKKTKILGILLVDHGSKSETSNQRLQQLASLYEESLKPTAGVITSSSTTNTKIIVQACHMEIARPSIQDGMAALLQAGVDEIVCHPYFLSPGRHVTKDIPQLIQESAKTLSVQIPVRTTEPVGSRTDVMIQVIHSLVQETSELL